MNNVISFPSFNSSVIASVAPSVAIPVIDHVNYAGKKQELFNVESHSINSQYGVIEGKKGLFVNGDNINIVSDKYEIVQPVEVYKTFASVAEKTGLTIDKVISNPKNGGLMISALYDNVSLAGDDHAVNLVFYTSHCGKYKTFLTLDTVRLACDNQVPMLYRNKDRFIFAEKHYKNALDIQLLESALVNIPASVEAHNIKLSSLRDQYLTKESFVEWYKTQLKLDSESKQYDSKIANIRGYYDNARGQREIAGNSAYKAFNCISYINTHCNKNTAMMRENTLLKKGSETLDLLDGLLAIA